MQTGTITLSMSRTGHRVKKLVAIVGAVAVVLPFVAKAWLQAFGAPLPYPLHVVLTRLPVLFPTHMAASGAALLLVPLALASTRVPNLHRVIGRVAITAIGLGGATALVVAMASVATPAARAGFFAQGLVWLTLAFCGLIAIRRKRRQLHARLMTATAIVTFAPVLLRLALGVAVRHRWPYASTYIALAWGGWLLPLGLYGVYLMVQAEARKLQLVGALQTAAPE